MFTGLKHSPSSKVLPSPIPQPANQSKARPILYSKLRRGTVPSPVDVPQTARRDLTMPEAADGHDYIRLIARMRRGDPQALAAFKASHRALFEGIFRRLCPTQRAADGALRDLLESDLASLFATYEAPAKFSTFAIRVLKDRFLFVRLLRNLATDPKKHFEDFQAFFAEDIERAMHSFRSGDISIEDIWGGIAVKLVNNDYYQLRDWAAHADGPGYIIQKIKWLALDEIKKQRRGLPDGHLQVPLDTPGIDDVQPHNDPHDILSGKKDHGGAEALDRKKFYRRVFELAAAWPARQQIYLQTSFWDPDKKPEDIATEMKLAVEEVYVLRRTVKAKLETALWSDPIARSMIASITGNDVWLDMDWSPTKPSRRAKPTVDSSSNAESRHVK